MESTIGAGDFKAKCLQLLDEVAARRESLIITKRGKPVARLVPMATESPLFGALTGSVLNDADLVAPIDAEWDAAK